MRNEGGMLEKARVRTRWLTGARYIQPGDLERSQAFRDNVKKVSEMDFSRPANGNVQSKGNDVA